MHGVKISLHVKFFPNQHSDKQDGEIVYKPSKHLTNTFDCTAQDKNLSFDEFYFQLCRKRKSDIFD